MTIKEIEELSGMTRANIRYYETEGLLTPVRADNGYRDYSPDDLRTLQRIRLLRAIGMSLEDIKAVQSGRMTLSASLYELEQELSGTQERLDWARETCRVLREENVTYHTLDAARYFDRRLPSAPQETTAEPVFRRPWRRYIARTLDVNIYQLVIVIVVTLLFRLSLAKISQLSLLWTILTLAAMGVVEPILLSRFGTTPGKWFMGLHITDLDGDLPSYETARSRTWGVLWWGYGLSIPIFSLIRGWISYHDSAEERDTPWEYETNQYLRRPPARRYWLAAAVIAALTATMIVAALFTKQVPHKGPLTPGQYCENYNSLADYYDVDQYLYPSGVFDYPEGNVVEVDLGNTERNVVFTQKNGQLTAVTLTVTADGAMVGDQSSRIQLMVLAAVKSQTGALSRAGENMVKELQRQPFRSYSGAVDGVTVDLQWDYEGYWVGTSMGSLVQQDEDSYANMVLTIAFE